jgi:large conductance mechanosensitive channel
MMGIITPPLGMLTDSIKFEDFGYTLRGEAGDPNAVVIRYGMFINAIISFLIVAVAIFVVIKAMNRIRQQFEAGEATPAPTTKKCHACKMEIPIVATKCGHCTSDLVR